jgi:predicted dehydrogenase
MKKSETCSELDRRSFLKGSSLATVMALLGGVPIRAQDTNQSQDEGQTNYQGLVTPLNCAVIGCGAWGREVLRTLARLPCAPVAAICETYSPYLKRAGDQLAPNAERYSDYRKALENKNVQAVIVTTPSHHHKEVVLAASQAGKHVYCEAPLAHTLADARAIAQAAKDAFKLNFQAGLQNRADPQKYHLVKFVRTGVMGKTIGGRCQWHRKQSWRLTSPNADREQELNWRLCQDTSPGLLGEVGVHQVDVANWFIMSPPAAVTGRGAVMHWNDGRTVPDTVQALFEYPGGELVTCNASLAYSFDADHELFYGTHSTIMCRDRRAWMFKEVDSPLLGWEVYACREGFYKESGIVLDANSTKQAAQSKKAVQDPLASDETPLHYALKAFVVNSNMLQAGVEDFAAGFDANDLAGLKDYLGTLAKRRVPAAGYREGLEATVTAIKANEAILKGQRIVFDKEWFALA